MIKSFSSVIGMGSKTKIAQLVSLAFVVFVSLQGCDTPTTSDTKTGRNSIPPGVDVVATINFPLNSGDQIEKLFLVWGMNNSQSPLGHAWIINPTFPFTYTVHNVPHSETLSYWHPDPQPALRMSVYGFWRGTGQSGYYVNPGVDANLRGAGPFSLSLDLNYGGADGTPQSLGLPE